LATIVQGPTNKRSQKAQLAPLSSYCAAETGV